MPKPEQPTRGETSGPIRSAAERTRAFFTQDQTQLAQALQGMTIGVWGTDRRFRVTQVAAWSRADDAKRPLYSLVVASQPGTVVSIPHAMQGIPLTLVVTQDEESGQPGACIQVKRAEPAAGDVPATGRPTRRGPTMTQTDIARALGITEVMQDQTTGTLSFREVTDPMDQGVLFYEPGQSSVSVTTETEPSQPHQAEVTQPGEAQTRASRRKSRGGEISQEEASSVFGTVLQGAFEEGE
ncbi:MAG: hypothetical protein KGJ07_04375 [Patescibacteria group bacterium]|nr:hypothetical protein [Patescibacteria group bacterium]MDE2590746.1 hypothetical protein [Patescibacteria group bacterium]